MRTIEEMTLKDKYEISVARVEELTKRLEFMRKAVEKIKDEIIGWSARADTLREIMSQMEGGAGPQQVRGKGAPTDSNEKSE